MESIYVKEIEAATGRSMYSEHEGATEVTASALAKERGNAFTFITKDEYEAAMARLAEQMRQADAARGDEP